MAKKKALIDNINQFLSDNEVETIYLTEVGRNFETSTGMEEGEIEIIGVKKNEFIYFPAGHNEEEFDEYLEKLPIKDLEEIVSSLEDWTIDREKTFKRAGL